MYCESSIFGAQSLFHFQPPENQALHTVDFIRDVECSAKTWRFPALSHQGGPQDHPKFARFDVPRSDGFQLPRLIFRVTGMIQRLDNHIHKMKPATSKLHQPAMVIASHSYMASIWLLYGYICCYQQGTNLSEQAI